MSKKLHNCCCDDHEIRVHKMTLDDGRHAERHVSLDEEGNEIVEIFAEKRPLKLEKRIHRQFKNVVAKETHETIKDGEVAHVEVLSTEPEVPLQVREKIGIANHTKIVDGDYVRKDEIGKIVADSVVAGVSALMENMEPVKEIVKDKEPQPIFKSQSIIENNTAEKKKDPTINIIIAIAVLVQLAFCAYVFLIM